MEKVVPHPKESTHAIASIRWPLDLKLALEARAAADNRSFSNYVISVLRNHLAEGEEVGGLGREPSAAYKRALAGTRARKS